MYSQMGHGHFGVEPRGRRGGCMGAPAQESGGLGVGTTRTVNSSNPPRRRRQPKMRRPLQCLCRIRRWPALWRVTAVPHEFDAGPFGKLDVTGILSGVGITTGNHFPDNEATLWDLSNGQVFVQKTIGWWQFYFKAGAYNITGLGVPLLSTVDTVKDLYGPMPVRYLKLVKGNFSVEVGAATYIDRRRIHIRFREHEHRARTVVESGERDHRGVKSTRAYKKFSASVSWNDGFYSDRYNVDYRDRGLRPQFVQHAVVRGRWERGPVRDRTRTRHRFSK